MYPNLSSTNQNVTKCTLVGTISGLPHLLLAQFFQNLCRRETQLTWDENSTSQKKAQNTVLVEEII